MKLYRVNDSDLAQVSATRAKSTSTNDQQPQEIVYGICENIKSAGDVEIYLLRSGRAAHIVRAVSGMLRYKSGSELDYIEINDKLSDTTSEPHKANKSDASGDKEALPRPPYAPNHISAIIHFVGLLDATKASAAEEPFDKAMTSKIRHFRHAMALYGHRSENSLDVPEAPAEPDSVGKSFIQA